MPAAAPALDPLPALTRAIAPVLDDLLTPALVIDLAAVEHNVAAFIAHVGSAQRWRPHVKTLKQSRLVRTLMAKRVGTFKCATLDELTLVLETAERVHPDGTVDVIVAYPLGRNEIRAVAGLLADHEGATIRLLADSPDHLRALAGWLDDAKVAAPIDVLLDVDLGMLRTGTSVEGWQRALEVVTALAPTRIVGLHGYDGHLEWGERTVAHDGYDRLVALAKALPKPAAARGRGDKAKTLVVTSGTHSFEHALTHAELGHGSWTHQVSPGTLVLSDLRTAEPAAHVGLHQAAFVLSRVVATPGDDRITLDAGSKALAPDRPAPACAVLGWPHLRALEASEEHRPCAVLDGTRPAVGDLLWLVPEHVCTTVNLHREVHYVRGDQWVGTGEVEAMSRHSRLTRRR